MRLQINEQERQNRDRQMQRGRYDSGNPPNFGSARSDYGDRAYGGRLNEKGLERGWWDKTSDEVSSWLGDEEAERRRRMDERRNRIHERNYGRRDYGGGYPLGFYPIESAYSPSNVYERDWHDVRAGDVMTRDVVTVQPNDAAQYAAQLMGECDCGAIPVVDWQGRMLGMITDRDITIRLVANGMNPLRARVGDCMTDKAFACHVNDSLENCMRSMSRHQIRRMPIVNDRNQVVGIISQADIAQHASQHTGTGERRAVSDVVCAVSEPSSGSYR
jgi:CBS domain-containing protein